MNKTPYEVYEVYTSTSQYVTFDATITKNKRLPLRTASIEMSTPQQRTILLVVSAGHLTEEDDCPEAIKRN